MWVNLLLQFIHHYMSNFLLFYYHVSLQLFMPPRHDNAKGAYSVTSIRLSMNPSSKVKVTLRSNVLKSCYSCFVSMSFLCPVLFSVGIYVL